MKGKPLLTMFLAGVGFIVLAIAAEVASFAGAGSRGLLDLVGFFGLLAVICWAMWGLGLLVRFFKRL